MDASGRRALLAWYAPRRAAYPWRVDPDPYRVMVSELMLQQTQAPRVGPVFERFVTRFPDVRALATAPRSEVLRAWAGLGYNRRAVALSEAARSIVAHHGGRVPSDPYALVALPGVGQYTATAVASVGFGVAVAAVDTNVRRVVSRHRLGVEPGASGARPVDVARSARAWLDRADPGAWNQALMDLGREVCRPQPHCDACPIRRSCRSVMVGRAGDTGEPAGDHHSLPRRRQSPFEGSFRQIRGGVVRVLRERPSATVTALAETIGHPADRVTEAVALLAADGIVAADGADGTVALAGG